MKKNLAVAAIYGTTLAMCGAMFFASALASPPHGFPYKDKEPQSKVLLGKILDASDSPLAGAVVYLTNTRTRAVKTYIAGKDGDYVDDHQQLDEGKAGRSPGMEPFHFPAPPYRCRACPHSVTKLWRDVLGWPSISGAGQDVKPYGAS